MREIIPFQSSNNFMWIPEGDYSLSQGQAFECFNFAHAPKLEVVAAWSATRPINRTLVVLLRETYSSLFRRFVYDPSLLLKQGD